MNIKPDLVSIIIPVYNGEVFLGQTIESVLSQTYDNWELLIVDNGSTDGSYSIIKSYLHKDSRIKSFKIDANSGGPAGPRNLGISMAKGKFIAFLDADDIWENNKLMKQINLINKYDIDVVHTSAFIIDNKGNRNGILNSFRKYELLNKIFNNSFIILIFNPIILSSALINSEVTLKFRENSKLTSIEDWCFWIEFALSGKKIKMLNEELVYYRKHSNSMSNDNGEIQYLKGLYLYSCLLVERKISIGKYIFLIIVQFARILKNRIKKI